MTRRERCLRQAELHHWSLEWAMRRHRGPSAWALIQIYERAMWLELFAWAGMPMGDA